MKKHDTYSRFENLTFEGFRALATDTTLSSNEKVGFPDSYREGKDDRIFLDIQSKLNLLNETNKVVLDIGTGCSGLANCLINLCAENNHKLILIDSPEMLNLLPDSTHIHKVAKFYPNDCSDFINEFKEKVDVILLYSVFQYIFIESNFYHFIDSTLSLLKNGGQLLLGDIPNISKRNRFISSPKGLEFHQQFYGPESKPEPEQDQIKNQLIDDSVIISIIMRCRMAGFHAYILPQQSTLPMQNRREDILIVRP